VFFIYYFQMRQRCSLSRRTTSTSRVAPLHLLYYILTPLTHYFSYSLDSFFMYARSCVMPRRRTPAQVASVCSKSGRGFVLFSCVCVHATRVKKEGKPAASCTIINIYKVCTHRRLSTLLLLSIYAPQRGVPSLQRSKSPRLHL
jgi:hypothetical protein